MFIKNVLIWFVVGIIFLIMANNTDYMVSIPEFWNSSVVETTVLIDIKLIFLTIGAVSILIAALMPIVKLTEKFENWIFAKGDLRIYISMFGLLAFAYLVIIISDFFR